MALVIMFVSLIVGVYSERFCMSLSLTLGNFSQFNGQYVDRGGRNDGKKYYEIDNTDQTRCDNPGYLFWNSNPENNWFIGKSFTLYDYMCTDIIDETDPSTCTNWDDAARNPVGVILTAGDCPYDAMCDTITLSRPAGNCSGTFTYIAPNQFGNGNGWYLIYQEKMEKWVCWSNIINVIGCPTFGVPNTWKQTNHYGMKRPFQDGDVQTYDGVAGMAATPYSVDFTCNGHHTLDPSPAPSPSPTVPSNSPSKTPSYNPTLIPSKAPSYNPTGDPSKAPSNKPTVDPSKAPSIRTSNPTQIPTNAPSLITLNPSSNPTNNPTKGPTENPTIAPTESTGDPSSNPSKAPSVATLTPSTEPTKPSAVPTNAPTGPSLEPTSSPTPTETVGEVQEDPVGFFKYYWENNRFYMVAVGSLLVIVLVICCFCICKPSASRREKYRYRGKGRSRAFQSRTGGSAPVQSVSYGRSQRGSQHRQ